MRLWQTFHDTLHAANSKTIPTQLQAICLKFQLFGRAKDLCHGIRNAQLAGEDDVNSILTAIYKSDALLVVSEVYDLFNKHWRTLHCTNKSIENFQLRFAANVSNFNSISKTKKLHEYLSALMISANLNIEDFFKEYLY